MKKIISICFIASGVLAKDLHFDILQTEQGNFTNATVTPATANSVMVLYNGGAVAVPFTNLSQEIQKHFGYDPAKAAADAEAYQKKMSEAREAARQAAIRAAALAGPVQKIQVSEIIDGFGRCRIQTANGEVKVRLGHIPKSLTDYFGNVKKQQSDIAAQKEYVADLRLKAKRALASSSDYAYGDVAYVNAVMAQRTAANNMSIDAEQANSKLEAMESKLEDLMMKKMTATTISAYSTGQFYGDLPCWEAKD